MLLAAPFDARLFLPSAAELLGLLLSLTILVGHLSFSGLFVHLPSSECSLNLHEVITYLIALFFPSEDRVL